MPDTTAKIRSKGLDATGVTEEIAQQLFAHKGKHFMAIVELKVDELHDKTDGKQRVDLVITQVEPAWDSPQLEDHLRELTRTMYYNRKVDDGQPTLPDSGGPDPKIGDVIGQGAALMVSDEQLADLEKLEAGEDLSYDDEAEDAPDEQPVDDDDQPQSNVFAMPFGDGQDGGRRDDPITDPHTFVDTTSGLCSMCDQPAGHPLHQAVTA